MFPDTGRRPGERKPQLNPLQQRGEQDT
jgi:hypothetical protein